MQTKLFKSCQTDQAAALLKNGQVVALPTETVYGLAADAKNEDAIKKIFLAKGRPSDHPLIVHIDSLDMLNEWAQEVSLQAKKLAEHFWPGPLTMVFKKRESVSNLITGGLDTVAIRMPNHPVILDVITKLGNAVVAPSANAHKKTSPTKPEHVLKTLDGKIAGIVDGGVCSIGIESTIIDMTKENPVILRPGSITAKALELVLKTKVQVPFDHNEKVSGNMKIHYQPEKPLFLLSLEQIENLLHTESNVAVMHYSDLNKQESCLYYKMSSKRHDYAKDLYATLHAIDATAVEKIFVETPPVLNEWSDVNDRLLKASKK